MARNLEIGEKAPKTWFHVSGISFILDDKLIEVINREKRLEEVRKRHYERYNKMMKIHKETGLVGKELLNAL